MIVAKLPEAWSNRRLRFDARLNPVKSEIKLRGDDEVSFIPMDAVGELGGLQLDEIRTVDDVYTGYTYFCDDDVVVAKITPCFENRKGAYATDLHNGVAFGTTELHVIRANPNLDARFLFYVTMADDFRSYGSAEMLGAGGQKRVPERFLKDWQTPLPAIDTQRRIAAFLDEKLAQIDGLIARKQALLERLAEKRQAIITQAVTKGLNPDVLIKDSGIEWLGQIPAHWDALPLRRLADRVVTGRTPPAAAGDFFTDGDVPWYTPGDFDGMFLADAEKSLTTDAFSEGYAVQYPANSVLLVGIGATLGKVAVAPVTCSSNQQINAITAKAETDAIFLAYSLHAFRAEIRMSASGNTLPILNQDKTKAIIMTRPPYAEQAAIGAILCEQDRKIEVVVEMVMKSIALLVERRSALVTIAVTGQIQGLQ